MNNFNVKESEQYTICVHNMYIFSVNASIFTMYAVSIASKSTLVNQWVSVVVANLSMREGRLKSSYITKSPNFILFYESCIPGVLCSTCIQLSSFQQPPSHSSSAQSHPPSVIPCFYNTGERAFETLLSAFPDMRSLSPSLRSFPSPSWKVRFR